MFDSLVDNHMYIIYHFYPRVDLSVVSVAIVTSGSAGLLTVYKIIPTSRNL